MDIAALILAILASVSFAVAALDVRHRTTAAPYSPALVPVGLTLLTVAWICQCVALTGSTV